MSNATGNLFINNTFFNASSYLVHLYSDAGNNTFCLNNFTNTDNPALYVNDTNGSNYYNCTYAGLNQGNIWGNTNNTTLFGTITSSIPGYRIATGGSMFPVNQTTNTEFSCNFQGCADYAPLVQTSNITISINSLQVLPNPFTLLQNVNCTANITSSAYGSYNVSYNWFQNGINQTSWAGATTAANNTIAVINSLNYTLLTALDNYSCSIFAANGIDNSGWVSSANSSGSTYLTVSTRTNPPETRRRTWLDRRLLQRDLCKLISGLLQLHLVQRHFRIFDRLIQQHDGDERGDHCNKQELHL